MDATGRSAGSNVLPLKSGQIDPLARDARECLTQLATTLVNLSERIDDRFARAVRLLQSVDGHVIVTGLGKSGLVGQKIAATLASTGTPSFFVHSAEALHGDLGMITRDDAVIMASYSGETREVIALLPHLRQCHVPTVALVGQGDSTLARGADVVLDVSSGIDCDANSLAPTSYTVAILAVGDALAASLSRLRGFRGDDSARLHPARSIGRRMMCLGDVVSNEGVIVVSPHASLRDCIVALAKSDRPLALVQDGSRLLGTIGTDEIDQALQNPECLEQPVELAMLSPPPIMSPEVLIRDAEQRMERDAVDAVLVVDTAGCVYGVFRR